MLLISFGTRPEWLKIKPLLEELDKKKLQYLTLFTGQHKDIAQSDNVDYKINIPNEENIVDRLSLVLIKCIEGLSRITALSSVKITHVMVQGDTTSALGIALAAFHNKIKVIHLEAGLRTHDLDNPFPEEANRQMISKITSLHFCPTIDNENNLIGERVIGEKHIVGNTSLDNLVKYVDKCDYDNVVLVTLHRRENHDIIKDWFDELEKLAIKFPNHKFILPLHPNPNVSKHRDILKNVKVVEPLKHEDLLNILVKCKFVITDSGGLQEESSFLGKKTIVCRKETERQEAIGVTSILCESPDELLEIVKDVMENYEVLNNNCPFGDGKSAKKIVKILQHEKIV